MKTVNIALWYTFTLYTFISSTLPINTFLALFSGSRFPLSHRKLNFRIIPAKKQIKKLLAGRRTHSIRPIVLSWERKTRAAIAAKITNNISRYAYKSYAALAKRLRVDHKRGRGGLKRFGAEIGWPRRARGLLQILYFIRRPSVATVNRRLADFAPGRYLLRAACLDFMSLNRGINYYEFSSAR